MKHWIHPDVVLPLGDPLSISGLIVIDGEPTPATLAWPFLLLDSLAFAKTVAGQLISDLALNREDGDTEGHLRYQRIVGQLLQYARRESIWTPDYSPLMLRTQLLPRKVMAADGGLLAYARKLMVLSDIHTVRAPDFILEVGDNSGKLRVIHRFAYIADHTGDVQSSVIDEKAIIDMAYDIFVSARDNTE